MSVEPMNDVLKVSAQTISAGYFRVLNGGSDVLQRTVKRRS